ncbi:unnamed protein product [Polarella glacialis]|uniref:RAP domain-containing protein n=1 Tax=Polarella glacialis TaxID=89957 RepID=A0A813G3X1_POLGL|nr:unnamed protein product [Polarella glacialis]
MTQPGRRAGRLGFRRCGNAASSALRAGQSSAELPPAPFDAAEGLAGVRRLLAAANSANVVPAQLCAQPAAEDFLSEFGDRCTGLEPDQLKQLLVEFAGASHMPSTLWDGGLAEEVPRAMDELPDLQAVHVALLLATLNLRGAGIVLQEVAEQLQLRAPDLTPAGLAGAAVALSQLGPWHSDPPPGAPIFEEVLLSLERMNPRELTACALAAATLGYEGSIFWQQVHGALLGCVRQLTPRHMADTLLALATHQLCPISLMEELQAQLPRVIDSMEPEEALTCGWAMCAMLLFHQGVLPRLLDLAVQSVDLELASGEAAGAASMQVNQLRQIALALELEPGAAWAKAALAPETWTKLRALPRVSADDHAEGQAAEAVVEEVGTLLAEDDVSFTLSEVVEDLYVVDVAVSGSGPASGQRAALVLDVDAAAFAQVPQSPWTTLKCRHLKKLGWHVEWLPLQRWDALDEEERLALVQRLVPGEKGRSA